MNKAIARKAIEAIDRIAANIVLDTDYDPDAAQIVRELRDVQENIRDLYNKA